MTCMSTEHSVPGGLDWDLQDRLHKSLRMRGMKTSGMAAVLGVHRNTITNYLTGRTPVDRRTLISWAFATGVPVEWLETGRTPSEGPNGDGNPLPTTRHARTDGSSHPCPWDTALAALNMAHAA